MSAVQGTSFLPVNRGTVSHFTGDKLACACTASYRLDPHHITNTAYRTYSEPTPGPTHRLTNTVMGVQGFQEYLEKRCPGAAVPVDLLKLVRTAARQPPHHHHPHHPHHPGPMPPPPPPTRILIDADSSLQRLYGGYQTDWVCGGEWNAMLGYLAALSQACLYQGGLELVVVFNGTLGKERWPEWARRAQSQRQTAQLIVNHVGSKATPPPRAWFLPPACLSHCVRLAMFRFRVRVSIVAVCLWSCMQLKGAPPSASVLGLLKGITFL